MSRGWLCLGLLLIGRTAVLADDLYPAVLTRSAADETVEARPVSVVVYHPYYSYFVGGGFYYPYPTYAVWPYYTYYGGPYYVYPNYATYVGTAYSAYSWGVTAPYYNYPYYPYYSPSYVAYATSYQPFVIVP